MYMDNLQLSIVRMYIIEEYIIVQFYPVNICMTGFAYIWPDSRKPMIYTQET